MNAGATVIAMAIALCAAPAGSDAGGRAAVTAALPRLAPFVRHGAPEALLRAALRQTGVPYRWGGRSRRGVDCVGLVFVAFRDAWGVPVRAFGRHVGSNAEVAARIGRLKGVRLADEPGFAQGKDLRRGDVLFFLAPVENPAEPAFARVDGEPVWVWHVGLHAGAGRVLHAAPGAAVVEEPIAEVLRFWGFVGAAVVRPGAR